MKFAERNPMMLNTQHAEYASMLFPSQWAKVTISMAVLSCGRLVNLPASGLLIAKQ